MPGAWWIGAHGRRAADKGMHLGSAGVVGAGLCRYLFAGGRERRPRDHGGRIGVMGPQAKERLEPAEQGTDVPASLRKEHGPADALILDFWPPELGGKTLWPQESGHPALCLLTLPPGRPSLRPIPSLPTAPELLPPRRLLPGAEPDRGRSATPTLQLRSCPCAAGSCGPAPGGTCNALVAPRGPPEVCMGREAGAPETPHQSWPGSTSAGPSLVSLPPSCGLSRVGLQGAAPGLFPQ
uniref:uncharacterized protein LOC118544052 n=1 Tax=Halichoerus grypus TaxID=9711 RepID=UPI001658E926|nr:uncharacterized protein LOC118544052 [Halichoerus grypus]